MSEGRTSLLSPEAMGSFDAEGNYTPRTIVDDDLGDADLEQAMGDSIIEFDDGDVIMGTVVKIDRDEVLLDIGFKSTTRSSWRWRRGRKPRPAASPRRR